MKKIFLLALITTGILCAQYFFYGCKSGPQAGEAGEEKLKKFYYSNIDSLMAVLRKLDHALTNPQTPSVIRDHFKTARLLFKRSEAITEYYFQGLTRRINGPALPDIKTEDGQVWPPHGFQVIEQYIFTSMTDSTARLCADEIKLLQNDLQFARSNMEDMRILPAHFQELVQHELIRIAALGISGFDSPLALYSLPESEAAVEGLLIMARSFYGDEDGSIEKATAAARASLQAGKDFVSFDRLSFMIGPLSELGDVFSRQDSVAIKPGGAFSGTFREWLRGEKFNADFYSPYAAAASNPQKILLGRKLFFDGRLSSTGRVSCGSCHQPDLYFTDGKAKAANFAHSGSLQRNTPSLYYASLQSHQFYDMRSVSLEDQAHDVMQNSQELNLHSQKAASVLNADTGYQKLFAEAFSGMDSIDGFAIRNAIGAYVRSLNPFKSRFDEYIRGNTNALNPQEIKGYNLFAGKAKCGTCHFTPIFNGNIPPWYTKSESEIIGVPQSVAWSGAVIDSDSGRFKINRLTELMFAFKTPTVRNIEKTGPYMHNGVYNNLQDVVEFYHKGGGTGIGISLPFQSLPFDSLQLEPGEKRDIIAFVLSLTDQQ